MNPVNGTATRGENLLRAYKHGFARGYLGYEMHPPRSWTRFSPTEFEAFASGYKCGQREAALDKQRLEAFHRNRGTRSATGFTPSPLQEITR